MGYITYVHCRLCGNLDLQRISRDYVEGAFAWLGRLIQLPAYRCAPCRNRFFSILRYHRIVPTSEPVDSHHHHEDSIPAAD